MKIKISLGFFLEHLLFKQVTTYKVVAQIYILFIFKSVVVGIHTSLREQYYLSLEIIYFIYLLQVFRIHRVTAHYQNILKLISSLKSIVIFIEDKPECIHH